MKQTVIRPVITEKSLNLASRGWYTFAVTAGRRKPEIAQAVMDIYGVSVESVRTIMMHGKVRSAGKRTKKVKRVDWKKALVQLKTGQKIDAFEVTGEAEKK
ncbi:MAG: 50S ribosomal protein L23 [Patescibacteria group bacterium]